MKKIFILIVAVCCVTMVNAQKHGAMDAQFAKAQFNEIKATLALDDKTAKELEPLYMNFMSELRSSKPDKRGPYERASEESIEEQTRAKLAMAVTIATVRQKYYDVFRTLLRPSQIVKMYQTERDIMRRVSHESGMRKEERERDEQ